MSRLHFASAVLVVLFSIALSPARADTYNLVGVTANFGGLGTDTLSGSFGFDASGNIFSAPNISVTGAFDPGNYDTFVFGNGQLELNDGAGHILLFLFDNSNPDLPAAGDTPIANIEIGTLSNAFGSLASGSADPVSQTPLPASLPLLVTGLGGLGFLGWRRKRTAQAVAA